MSVRTTLRLGSALLGLTLVAAACSGSAGTTVTGGSGSTLGSGSGAGSPGVAAPASAEPTFDLGSLLRPNPTPDATPASSPSAPGIGAQTTPRPVGTTPPAISTTKASSLLSQVDHLLNEVNSELSNADAAANNPGE